MDRTGEIRFNEVLWPDGHAVISQAVDDEGVEMVDSLLRSVTSLGSIFTLGLNNRTEQKIRVSFVRAGTKAVVTFSEVFLTVLDIGCIKEDVVS